jgi:hypothetical protein
MTDFQREIQAYGLLYIYEYILTVNYQFLDKNTELLNLIGNLQKELNYTPSVLRFVTIENEMFNKFGLEFNDYISFKSSNFSLKTSIDSLLNLEVDPNAKHVSKIPGISGKGDLSNKAHYRALSPDLNKDTALAFTFGKTKHGTDNFRKMTPAAAGEIYDALMRHLEAFHLGEFKAEDSNIHHLAHACANLHMLYRLCVIYSDEEVVKIITGGDIDNGS